MEAAANVLLAIVIKTENIVVVCSVAIAITTARRVLPELFARPLVIRLLPLLPLMLCTAALWIPWVGAPAGAGARALLGCLLGSFVGQAYKVLRQTGRRAPPVAAGVDQPPQAPAP